MRGYCLFDPLLMLIPSFLTQENQFFHTMNLSISLHKPPYLLLLLLLSSLLSLTVAADPTCTFTAASTASPIPFPKSEVAGYYAQAPTQQSPESILDRLESESKIRNKLALYAIATDGKNFSALSNVFTQDVVLNFLPTYGVVRGLDNFVAVLMKTLAEVDTQISLGTELIKVFEDNPCIASSFSYFTVTYLGKGKFEGKVWKLFCY